MRRRRHLAGVGRAAMHGLLPSLPREIGQQCGGARGVVGSLHYLEIIPVLRCEVRSFHSARISTRVAVSAGGDLGARRDETAQSVVYVKNLQTAVRTIHYERRNTKSALELLARMHEAHASARGSEMCL